MDNAIHLKNRLKPKKFAILSCKGLRNQQFLFRLALVNALTAMIIIEISRHTNFTTLCF